MVVSHKSMTRVITSRSWSPAKGGLQSLLSGVFQMDINDNGEGENQIDSNNLDRFGYGHALLQKSHHCQFRTPSSPSVSVRFVKVGRLIMAAGRFVDGCSASYVVLLHHQYLMWH